MANLLKVYRLGLLRLRSRFSVYLRRHQALGSAAQAGYVFGKGRKITFQPKFSQRPYHGIHHCFWQLGSSGNFPDPAQNYPTISYRGGYFHSHFSRVNKDVSRGPLSERCLGWMVGRGRLCYHSPFLDSKTNPQTDRNYTTIGGRLTIKLTSTRMFACTTHEKLLTGEYRGRIHPMRS